MVSLIKNIKARNYLISYTFRNKMHYNINKNLQLMNNFHNYSILREISVKTSETNIWLPFLRVDYQLDLRNWMRNLFIFCQ